VDAVGHLALAGLLQGSGRALEIALEPPLLGGLLVVAQLLVELGRGVAWAFIPASRKNSAAMPKSPEARYISPAFSRSPARS
jgi:hypothetical protein